MGHIQRERLPKSKMTSSDDRFTFEIIHVLHFGNELNEELCCKFIFTNLQQSLDPFSSAFLVIKCGRQVKLHKKYAFHTKMHYRSVIRVFSDFIHKCEE